MDNIEFNAYMTDVFRLVRTMVIKMEAIAIRDNSVQQAASYPVSSDKRTWRYYMNMNGDYHPTDEIMTIVSIDTGDEIVFNKQNMLIHLATYREYSAGGYWFNRLVEKYPAQADLIRGILAPIPYEDTIEADDYKILKYNKALVLWNEDQLIPQLQETIYALMGQIFDHEYRFTDNLMLPVGVMHLYADLIKAVCVIRHEAIGTRYAHDFYIWSHIDSFGDFSKHKASLSKYQIMWMYRNIAWLKNNPGAQYTFDRMQDNLLTHAGIPLAKYDMVTNTADQVTDLAPTPLYRKLQLNLLEQYGRTASFIDTEQMIDKQQSLAKENFDQSAIWYDDALKKGRYSLHSELPTKALESKMADYTNRHADTKMSVTYNNWVYLAAKGYYKGRILVTDPKSGKQVRFPVGDAYHIWRYLTDLSRGQAKDYITPASYQNVLKVVPPTIEELIDIGGPELIKPYLAQDIRNLWIPTKIFIAPEYLMQYSDEVYGIMWQHKKLYAQFYDLNRRARVQHTVDMMYESGITTLTDVATYKELLDRYELFLEEYTPEESRNFAWEIFKAVTGWDTSSNPSLRIKQNALIDIMMRLSSYSIHTIREMDDGTDLTELPNETFIGDSRWTGSGNGSYADTSGVMMSVPTNMDGIRALESKVDLIDNSQPVMLRTGENFALIISNDHFKRVDLSTNLLDYAVKIIDDSYLRVVAPDITGLPDTDYDRLYYPNLEVPIPITQYGRLFYPHVDTNIPDTNYGRLRYPHEDVNIPETNYGRLKYPNLGWEIKIPGTDYGRLHYENLDKKTIPRNTDYGRLQYRNLGGYTIPQKTDYGHLDYATGKIDD